MTFKQKSLVFSFSINFLFLLLHLFFINYDNYFEIDSNININDPNEEYKDENIIMAHIQI